MGPPEPRGLKVLRGLPELPAPGLPERPALPGSPEPPDLKASRERPELPAPELPERPAPREPRERPDLKGLRERPELRGRPDLSASDRRGSPERPGPSVPE